MKLNIKDLKKIIYNFNRYSNRLLHANYKDYTSIVKKYVLFLKETPLIYDYISDCGESGLDLPEIFHAIEKAYGRFAFPIGESVVEEIRDIFAILNYIAENDIQVHYGVGMAYTTSKHFQDHVEAFNDRVVNILISHIEAYLTNIGIDMGMDERATYSITVQNGQVNIATDSATLSATSTVDARDLKLAELIEAVQDCERDLSDEDAEMLNSSLQMIREEANSPKPRKGVFQAMISALQTIKEPAELVAAVFALIQFIQTMFLD